MVPRVVSVPTDLGPSGDRLWVPEAGNTVHSRCGVAESPGTCVEVPVPLTAPPPRLSEQARSEEDRF